MIPLLLLATFAASFVAFDYMFSTFDEDDAEEAVDEVDQGGGPGLLDAIEISDALTAEVDDRIGAGAQLLDDQFARDTLNYPGEGSVEIEGTDGNDIIDAGEDVEVSFGQGGDDVLLGANHDQVLFGGDGDDVLFGEGGGDQIFGDSGTNTLFGGDGGDLIVSESGTDAVYGGAGDDAIFSNFNGDTVPGEFGIVSGGEGNDGIQVQAGTVLIELGAGTDDVMVRADELLDDQNTLAIITDFDPAEDQLLLEVLSPDFAMEAGVNGIPLEFEATLIDTSLGPATLVVPAASSQAQADAIGAASVGHAVLIGVTPEDLDAGNVFVVLSSATSNQLAPDSASGVFGETMGGTEL